MQMFYGDYQFWDADEPEEDEQSNQNMDGSQFSDDIDVIANDEEEEDAEEVEADSVEADSPVNVAQSRQAYEDKDKTDRSKGQKTLMKKKSSLKLKAVVSDSTNQ